MSPTNEEVKKATEEMVTPYEQGDTYDEDTGDFLGSLSIRESLPPAQIAVLVNGYWYVFKPDSRYKEEEDVAQEVREVAVELEREQPPVIPPEESIFPKE